METFRIFSSSIYLPNNTRAKKVDVIFTFTHSLLNPRTNYETMDSVFVLGPDIQDTDIQARVKKNWEIFSKKSSIFSRKTKASYLMTKTWLVKKAHILAICLEEEWFLYLSSVLRNMSYKWEKIFRHFFSSIFLPKKTKSEKKFWRQF